LSVCVACASHPRFLLLRLAKSMTGTCMFSMIWVDTFAMSPYSSVFAHTCAAIPWAFGNPHGLLVGLALSSSSESSLALSTDSPLSTSATHCLRDVLRMGNVRLLTVGSALSWVHAVLRQLEGCHVLSYLGGHAAARTSLSRGRRLHPQHGT